MKIQLKKEFDGNILDIGGGGEGVIGRIYGKQVTAIDNRQEELDEAPDGFTKLLMNARSLAFPAYVFDHVTFFYSLMYMEKSVQEQAVSEALRVLRPGGSLHIWDAKIDSASPEPFIVSLDIDVNGKLIHADYGILIKDARQDEACFTDLCERIGLSLVSREECDGNFYLRFLKRV